MGATVQFYGAGQVLRAFTARGLPTWAIFIQKNLWMPGSGADELKAALSMLPPGSEAIYTLRCYDIEDSEVRERTESCGSFNFKMSEESSMGSMGGGSYEYRLKLEERIKKLEGEAEEEEESILGAIGSAAIGLLERPSELVQVIGAIRAMFQGQQPTPQQYAAVGAVVKEFPKKKAPVAAEVVAEPEKIVVMDKNEKLQRLAAAIDLLEKNDSEIVVHLEKLAKISEEKPGMFKMLLGSLNDF